MAAWNKAVGGKNLTTIMHALIRIIYLGPQTGRSHLDQTVVLQPRQEQYRQQRLAQLYRARIMNDKIILFRDL